MEGERDREREGGGGREIENCGGRERWKEGER